jgi:hypothetical protein
MHEVEPIADNDERKLVLELGLLEEILDLLRVVIVALSTDALHFSDLVGAGGGLNVLEVNLGILAKVYDGSKVVVETWERVSLRRFEGVSIFVYLRSS